MDGSNKIAKNCFNVPNRDWKEDDEDCNGNYNENKQ